MAQTQTENEYNFLAYSYNTWGSYGQHDKVIKLVIDVDQKSQKALWEVVSTKWVNNDNRKNRHREAYVREKDVLSLLKGKILKVFHEYQSSSRRKVEARYYIIDDSGIKEVDAEVGVKVDGKYYDIIKLGDKKIFINKDEVIVQ